MSLSFKLLEEKADSIKIAGINCLEYMIDNLGCNIANYMGDILK